MTSPMFFKQRLRRRTELTYTCSLAGASRKAGGNTGAASRTSMLIRH